jgi:uncharacterized membrane protein
MLTTIFAIKFVHVLTAAAIFGAWLAVAIFMLLAHRSGNTSVVALTAQFVVSIEKMIMIAGLALLPLSGFPLATAIGLTALDELWIDISLPLYAVIVLCWIGAFRTEIRIRGLAREAALDTKPLSGAYRKLFRRWCLFAAPIITGMTMVIALMIWQPGFN